MNVDVLAIGAHPDDAELGVGGLLAKLSAAGHRVGILDLTRGEMGSRGTPEIREQEAQAAAARLGALHRANAGLPDGQLENSAAQRETVATWLRRFRPAMLLAPYAPDRHPDHAAAHALVHDSIFVSGLHKLTTDAAPWRPVQVYYYTAYYEESAAPALIVDVTAEFGVKMEALAAHASQFYNAAFEGPETYVSSQAFWERIEARARYWGGRAGFTYGEALYTREPIAVSLPPGLPAPGAATETPL